MEDADGVIRNIVACAYNENIQISDGIRIRFTDVGHLLGSASIEVWLTEDGVTKRLYSRVISASKNHPLIRGHIYTEGGLCGRLGATYGDRYPLQAKEGMYVMSRLGR